MTTRNTFASESKLPAYFIQPILLGFVIALLLIIAFLLKVESSPTWPKYWMARPLIIVPLAGAAGGAFFALLRPMRRLGGWVAALAYVLSFVAYVIALWMGTAWGLVLWD